MIDFEKEAALPAEERFRLWAGSLQLWRLCSSGACRRARSCRGSPMLCATRLADWAEAVQRAAQMERYANDPVARAERDDLAEKIRRLAATMASEAPRGS